MGRKKSWRTEPVYASLGDAEVKVAGEAINHLFLRSAAAQLDKIPSREGVVPMLFEPWQIKAATAARGVVVDPGRIVSYRVPSMTNVTLNIDYNHALYLPLAETAMLPQTSIVALLDLVHRAELLYLHFEEVKAVLRYLNRNATRGAVRYYWPQAMKLCPNAGLSAEVSNRHAEPEGVNRWIQRFRDSAATLASAALLPSDIVPRIRSNLWLTFSERSIRAASLPDYTEGYITDHMNLNL